MGKLAFGPQRSPRCVAAAGLRSLLQPSHGGGAGAALVIATDAGSPCGQATGIHAEASLLVFCTGQHRWSWAGSGVAQGCSAPSRCTVGSVGSLVNILLELQGNKRGGTMGVFGTQSVWWTFV